MRKLLSLIRWALNMLIPLLGFITAPFIFPLLYPFRNTGLRNVKPFWYYFDDEDGVYGADYWRKAKGLERNFWTAYKWNAIRNPAWNLHTVIIPKKGEEKLISWSGQLTQSGKIIMPTEVAVIHFENKDGSYAGNTGDIISLKYSKLGSVFLWFTKGGRLYWRYSLAKNVYRNHWIELQLGTGYRHTFRFKHFTQ